jgi:hypothetical protein
MFYINTSYLSHSGNVKYLMPFRESMFYISISHFSHSDMGDAPQCDESKVLIDIYNIYVCICIYMLYIYVLFTHTHKTSKVM